jgi:hypothetical protein
MFLLKDWVSIAEKMMFAEPDFYCGCRKILRRVEYIQDVRSKSDLALEQFGFTMMKQRMLEKFYVHEESIEVARELWKKRTASDKYGSVGITTYNHFRKGKSGMGPCIQAVVFTHIKHRGEQRTEVDVHYRTTEIFKKFPADLILLRDILLPPFATKVAPFEQVRFVFDNVTVHPMYWITLAPYIPDPIHHLEKVRSWDDKLWLWIVKWTGRYICPEYNNGIEKFAQAVRTRNSGLELLGEKKLLMLQDYMRINWPGVRHKKKS